MSLVVSFIHSSSALSTPRNAKCTSAHRVTQHARGPLWVFRFVLRVRRLEEAFLRPPLSASWWPRERYARFAAGDGAFFFSEGDTVEYALIRRLRLLLRFSHYLSHHLFLRVCTLDGYFTIGDLISFHHVAHPISVQLPSLLHRRQHARKCCEDCSASVCGYGKHGSLAFHGSGARVLLSGLEKSLLLVPNTSAVQKCCSEYWFT